MYKPFALITVFIFGSASALYAQCPIGNGSTFNRWSYQVAAARTPRAGQPLLAHRVWPAPGSSLGAPAGWYRSDRWLAAAGVAATQYQLAPMPMAAGGYTGYAYAPLAAGTDGQTYFHFRPLIPLVPPPPVYYFGQGVLGQPKVYVPGQPLRNVLRYLTP